MLSVFLPALHSVIPVESGGEQALRSLSTPVLHAAPHFLDHGGYSSLSSVIKSTQYVRVSATA